MNKRTSIFLAMMLILALLTAGYQAPAYALVGVKQGTISVIGTDPANPIFPESTVQYGENETASEALVQLLGADKVGFTSSSWGDMITTIDDLSADKTHFWAFYINGVAAKEGAGTYKVQDGDKLSFKYESFEPVTDQPSNGGTTPSNGSTAPSGGPLSEGTLKTAIDSVSQFVTKQKIGDWEAISLKQLGKQIPASYLDNLIQLVKDKKGSFRLITDTEKYTLAILAAGGDPTNIVGYNLVEDIYNGDVAKQGLNGVAYALIALDSANFKVPDTAKWTREKLVQQILDKQNQDGGWAWDGSTASDVDTTGIVLMALAPYKNQNGVKDKIDKAVEYITAQFNASKIDNSSTAAQVIIALSALGIDANGPQFTKDNTSLVQFFLTFQNADGGFDYNGGDKSDEFSTAFGIQALAAYQLFTAGKGSLFSLPLVQQKPETIPTKNEQPITQPASASNSGHTLPDTASKSGNPLPNTASNTFNLVLIGLLIILLGSALFLRKNQAKA
jgi:LPXTG-motif cell wall-anchored protein